MDQAAVRTIPAVNPRFFLWIATVAFLTPLVFALYTHHVWEDYLIAFRSSKNLATGYGLVYQPGERVASFSSPIGVLLPALFYRITGSDEATLWCFRLISCSAVALAAVTMARIALRAGLSQLAVLLSVGLFIFESKLVDFSVSGMETAFTVLFCAQLLHAALELPDGPSFSLGAAMAGLLWARIDGFIPGMAIIAGVSLLSPQLGLKRIGTWIWPLLRAAGWTTLLYGPWVLCSWWYYGTPVPHTVIAKGLSAPVSTGLSDLVSLPALLAGGKASMNALLQPSYSYFGGWPLTVVRLQAAAISVIGFAWLLPKLPRFIRGISFALFLGSFYLEAIPRFPWYYPVWNVCGALALGSLAAFWIESFADRSWGRSVARIAALGLIGMQVLQVAATAVQTRHQQNILEDQGRRKIGEWLAMHAAPKDTVFLEPLGYVGYFSKLKMLDFPGLCSPEVVAARREVGDDKGRLISKLKPTWALLRPEDLLDEGFQAAPISAHYDLQFTFDARASLNAVEILPGRKLLENDAVFHLFHRRPEP